MNLYKFIPRDSFCKEKFLIRKEKSDFPETAILPEKPVLETTTNQDIQIQKEFLENELKIISNLIQKIGAEVLGFLNKFEGTMEKLPQTKEGKEEIEAILKTINNLKIIFGEEKQFQTEFFIKNEINDFLDQITGGSGFGAIITNLCLLSLKEESNSQKFFDLQRESNDFYNNNIKEKIIALAGKIKRIENEEKEFLKSFETIRMQVHRAFTNSLKELKVFVANLENESVPAIS